MLIINSFCVHVKEFSLCFREEAQLITAGSWRWARWFWRWMGSLWEDENIEKQPASSQRPSRPKRRNTLTSSLRSSMWRCKNSQRPKTKNSFWHEATSSPQQVGLLLSDIVWRQMHFQYRNWIKPPGEPQLYHSEHGKLVQGTSQSDHNHIGYWMISVFTWVFFYTGPLVPCQKTFYSDFIQFLCLNFQLIPQVGICSFNQYISFISDFYNFIYIKKRMHLCLYFHDHECKP